MSDVVVVGSCMIDFISYTPHLPKAGETIHGTKFLTGFGGKGANQCVAAARLGSKTTFVARLGDDTWGKDYVQKLEGEKVDTKFVLLTREVSSGIAQIVVDDNGENQIVIVAGANLKLIPEDLIRAENSIKTAKVLVLQLETPMETAIAAMKLCDGVSILNGAPAIEGENFELLKLPTIFCVNESEASVFAKTPVKNIDDAKKAVGKLLRRGCRSVILTLGPEGALYASKDQPLIHLKTPKVTAIDTTGAGDCFIGALAHMIANYEELEMAKKIEIACHVAAISVTIPGTQTSYPGGCALSKVLRQVNLE